MTGFDVDPDRAGLPDAWRQMCRLLDRYEVVLADGPGPAQGLVTAACRRCAGTPVMARRFDEIDLGHRDSAVGELVTQILRHEAEAHTGDGFRCPECGMVTRNRHDVDERYCPACHWWTGNPELRDARRTEQARQAEGRDQ